VLEIRVRTNAGVPIRGCRQGIEKLKLFAEERALTYAKVGEAASRDRGECQPQEDGSDGGALRLCNAASRSSDAPANAASRMITASGKVGADHAVLDLELMEFRKRVSWSVRDLKHILSELQLSVRDVPYTTLATALTRECEDRSTNYELLEFIGDAVMDFLVVADACMLSNAVYQQQQQQRVTADEASAGESPPPLPDGWTTVASRVALPQHCWMSDAQPLYAVMADTVTSVLCRNRVIAELLPPTVARHFNEELYPNLAAKVRADVFEAIIGAAYRSGTGLDRLRQLLRRLFSFLPAVARTAAAADTPCAAELLAALQMCPQLLEADALCVESLLCYRTNKLLELAPQLREVGGATVQAMEKDAGVNTHLISSRLPRIQAKEFATTFTTGSVYAYRRLFSFDTVRLHNRVLHLFSEKSIGFMNEIFTDTIHLVLDIDKVALASWGLLQIMWAWYTNRCRCPAGMFALDCSGRTMVNKELRWKDSCHIHFPQVMVNVDTWDRLVTDIRGAVVSALAAKEARLRDTVAAHARDYWVWLRRSSLMKEVKAVGGEARPHMWSYCDADSLLQLARTCSGVRQSVLEHVAYLTFTLRGMARFAGVASSADIFVGESTAEEELVVVEHQPTRVRLQADRNVGCRD
jgi:hypothetical protein